MENDNKTQRIAEVQDFIMSGGLARMERREEPGEREEDTSYRIEGDVERGRKVLEDFLAGKMFVNEESDESD